MSRSPDRVTASAAQSPAAPAASEEALAAGAVPSMPLAAALRWLVHALLYLLVLLTAVRAVGTMPTGYLVTLWALLAALVSVYSIGARRDAQRRRRAGAHDGAGAWSALVHLIPTVLLWVAALMLSPDALWIAFAVDFAVLYALPWAGGIAALLVVTVTAVLAHAGWAAGATTVAGMIGPGMGALVALGVVAAVRALQGEIRQRTILAERLLATQRQLAEREREAATAAERERIARELHDTVAQSSLSVQLLLDAAQNASQQGDDQRAAQLREQARGAAVRTTAQARRLVDEDVPAVDPAQLRGALETLIHDAAVTTNARVQLRWELEADAQQRITPRTARTIVRLVQGLLANAVHHADASRIAVSLSAQEDVLVDVVDDGLGIPDDEPDGMGLRTARARARSLGGSVTIESTAGSGTAVQVRLPLPLPDSTTPTEATA